ncbi:MAG: hypothetical protein KDA93_03770 [Planctomycetaceae bacterium]|nr:hypothetical protein [Planctomycetaceae bacterium]
MRSLDLRTSSSASRRPQRTKASLRISCWLFSLMIIFTVAASANAQDFRVVTNVSYHDQQTDRWDSLARSLTLFHAGKVYDFVEAVGEVVVFDPMQDRFVILSLNGNALATEVPFEELHQFLKVGRAETFKYISELQLRRNDAADRAMQSLTFQLKPQFNEGFDPANGKLRLSSEFITYEVETDIVDRPMIVQQYLQWADWTARLNSIIHPQAVAPEVRLAVNEALRTRDRVPTQVDLKLSLDGDMHLRAEHTFKMQLTRLDRDAITKWEGLRTADNVRWVDFREYQRVLVTSAARSTASR